MPDISYKTIHVKPLTRHIGAEISGIDLSIPLSAEQVAELRRALLDHLVIFFRRQPINLDQHLALGRYFGTLHVHPNSPGPDGYPEVLPIHTDANSRRIAGDRWHSDVSCDEAPPLGSILHLHTVPPVGGDTLFSSAYAVYESLSPGLRGYLEGLTATHDGGPNYRERNRLKGIDDTGKVYPKASHPVVRTHPESGRKGVFVNPAFTTHLDNVSKAESDAILNLLFDRFAVPDYQVRFTWDRDSIAFWDNRSCQHLAVWDYFPEVRSGYRVTINGDKPYLRT
ncbi:TauD/TfdA dioxygenase family protein [Bordetella genomosp. 10]|uniref:TauD/TfdA dioxygenase family protein n=1 Tax=Bordetella genomosp. 10 TaxID=1416804 RepID=UPI001C534128|nr:TauD/TfdA family dioxygenase [Bordetella genomosp. 10]